MGSKQGDAEGFTKAHAVTMLVYYEVFGDIVSAIEREKRLKRWQRSWKLAAIEKANPTWMDLYDEKTGDVAALPGTQF